MLISNRIAACIKNINTSRILIVAASSTSYIEKKL